MQTRYKPLKIAIYQYKAGETPDFIVEKFLDYLIRRVTTLNPNDPPPSREVLRGDALNPHPHYANLRFIAYAEELDQVVSSGILNYDTEASPSYHENANVCFGGVAVEEIHRRKGVGRQMMKTLVNKAHEEGKLIFHADSEEESGQEFMRNLPIGEMALVGAENRLYLNNVNWDDMKRWVEEGKIRSPTTKLVYFTDAPDDLIEKYAEFYTRAENTVPKGELEWELIFTPEARRVHERSHRERGNVWHTFISVEEDGAISGMTEMIYNDKEPYRANQELTAVLPEYRGRGLGKWLKAHMLQFIHEKYNDIEYIVTGNADVNAPMLAINTKMGYQRYRGSITYKYKVQDLVEYFQL